MRDAAIVDYVTAQQVTGRHTMFGKILSPYELKTLKGIRFSRAYIWRLTKAGKFPAPIKVGDKTNGYLEAEIDAWIAERVAERDERAAAA